jgi:hypothetical protein
MSKINWLRLIIGGLIAAVICFMTDGFLHERLLSADWQSVYTRLGGTAPKAEHGGAIFYFILFDLGRGLLSIFIYVLMRTHFRPGPKTAALAGIVAWIAISVTTPGQFIPLGFFSNELWVKTMAFQLVTFIVAAIAGAAVYKDPESSV